MQAFKLQICGVSVSKPVDSSSPTSSRSFELYLDVKAEKETSKRLSLGNWTFNEDREERFEGLTYVASTPVRVRAFAKSLFLASDLGVHTLYKHLRDPGDAFGQGSLVFGTRRRGTAVVRVHYRLSRVLFQFQVALTEVRCLNQSAWWPGGEHVTAAVGSSVFDLGSFRALESAAHNDFKLALVSRAEARFDVARKWSFGPKELGRIAFVPGDELEGGDPSFLLVKDVSGNAVVSSEELAGSSIVVVTVVMARRFVFVFNVTTEPALLEISSVENSVVGLEEGLVTLTEPSRCDVRLLIDGLETFERYFDVLIHARHSISILAWELSLTFGLITCERSGTRKPRTTPKDEKWVSLEDVLLLKALEGIPVRIVVWRHQLLSYLNRFLYLGDVTIESEVTRLVERGKQLGVHVVMIHSSSGVSASSFSGASAFADPHLRQLRPTITIVIVGNPRGVLSSHHEKLVLVDAECAAGHGVAFIGGFDIARGRYDQPLHQIPLPYFELNPAPSKAARFTGPAVQPVLRRIRFLWHDVQVELSNGPVVQQLQLHFAQRWIFAFSGNVAETRSYFLPPARALCQLQPTPRLQEQPIVQLSRCWRGVLDVQKMFEVHRQAIRSAKKFLYIEHQYPFHNWGLAQEMCEALRANPDLLVVIVTAIKTDLPTGLVGDLVDWSQDHITQHLLLIQKEAPERVLVTGLCQQDEYRKLIKPIYVHTKLLVADDALLLTGSANMDDMSFFFSSEVSILAASAELCRMARGRLCAEHLGMTLEEVMSFSFGALFAALRSAAHSNAEALQARAPLRGRLVLLAPRAQLSAVLARVHYPNKLSKALYKMGLDTQDWVDYLWSKAPLRLRSKL